LGEFQNLDSAIETAEKATHCGMCRIDFLETGLCPAGVKHGFAAYWPDGRMELLLALKRNELKPTEKLVEIVNSCDLCGRCDRQCHFITNLRPSKVQEALKNLVEALDEGDFVKVNEDSVLKELREIVGVEWAANDPAIVRAYSRSIIPQGSSSSFYVVMPKSSEQIVKIVETAKKNGLPLRPRGAGTFLVLALHTLLAKPVSINRGIIIDFGRMKKIEVNPENYTARIEPGVTAFELQKAAYANNMRACVAEPAASVCANIASFGIISTWMNAYGWGSDLFVDAEYVGENGKLARLSDEDTSNPYAASHGLQSLTLTPSKIVTQVTVKLFPKSENEHALLIPYSSLPEALAFAHKLARKNLGLSVAVISRKYLSDFIAPTNLIAKNFNYVAEKHLKMNYLVDVVGDAEHIELIKKQAGTVIEERMAKNLILGVSKLAAMKDSELLKIVAEEPDPLKVFLKGPLKEHLEKILGGTTEEVASAFDEDLQEFFGEVYSRPEMTDVIWLHSFRILPSRMIRQKLFMVRGGFMRGDDETILKTHDTLRDVGEKHGLENALGFISFLEHGKLAFLEYDYYFDHNDRKAMDRLNKAIGESLVNELMIKNVLPVEYVFHKGLTRKEHLFHPLPKGISKEEIPRFQEIMNKLL
jgi:FAD/FMN-containing dehydrogenase